MYVNICICTIAQWPERRWCYPDDGFLSSDSLASRHGVRLQAVDAHLPPHKLLVKPAVLAHPPCYPQLPPAPPTLPCLHNTNHSLSTGTFTNHSSVYAALCCHWTSSTAAQRITLGPQQQSRERGYLRYMCTHFEICSDHTARMDDD